MAGIGLRRHMAVAWCVVAMIAVHGCETPGPARVDLANQAYQKGDYAQAYREAQQAVYSGQGSLKLEAAYIAGLSAYHLNDRGSAVHYLKQAASGQDARLSGEALAMLGLIYAQQGKDQQSAQTLLQAARHLPAGQDRAEAYYHAAKAQQKLGQWSQARTTLRLARSASRDEAFRRRLSRELDTEAFTLQIGAFTDHDNAQRAAENLAVRVSALNLGAPRLVPARDDQQRQLTLVQVGRFSTHADAEAARRQLRPLTAIVVSLTAPR